MITAEDINKYPWEEKIAQADRPGCMSYSTIFYSCATECEKSGDNIGREIYRFLGSITSIHLDNDTPNNPFKPQLVIEGKRTVILEDFSDNELNIIAILMGSTQSVVLRARFADMLWVARKDHRAAQISSEAYLTIFKNIDVEKEWVHHINTFERGLFIARVLGREKPLFNEYTAHIENIIRARASSEKTPICVRLIELLYKYKAGNYEEMAVIADQIADNISSGNGFLCRQYYEISAQLYRRVKKDEEAQRVLIKKGESFVSEAESAVGRPQQGYIAATHFLANAVECLRQNKAPKERIEELHKKLLEWQELSLGDMKAIEHTVDISHIIESVTKGITGKSLLDAVFYLALGHPIINLKELRERTEQQIKQYPIQHLFKATTLSDDGRVIAEKPSILNASPEVYEDALESEMYSQLSRFDWPMRAQCYIDTCREIIRNEHRPSFRDLSYLVQNNPFVPPGHEELFLKGIHAGFSGDLDLCAHYLIPQIEESIRYILKQNCIVTSKLDSKFIQEERLLGTLLAMPETIQIFGEELVFELRGLLCEKHGCDLRNRLAHGFMTYRECFSYDVVLLWWHVIRICVLPIYTALKQQEKAEEKKKQE